MRRRPLADDERATLADNNTDGAPANSTAEAAAAAAAATTTSSATTSTAPRGGYDVERADDHDPSDESDEYAEDPSDRACPCCTNWTCIAGLAAATLVWTALVCLNPSSLYYPVQQDMALRYDVLSSLVQFSRSVMGAGGGGYSAMHTAIGLPDPDPSQVDGLVVQEALRRLQAGCTPSEPREFTRAFDAGSGWGGTAFALERALRQEASGNAKRSRVDGATLSAVQVIAATQAAREQGVDSRVHFHLMSFDEVAHTLSVSSGSDDGIPASSAALLSESYGMARGYDVAVAVESLGHSPDVAASLSAIGASLAPSDRKHCRAAHVR